MAAARGRLAEARALLTDGADQAAAVGLITTEALLLTEAARYGAARDVADRLAALAEVCDGTLAPARARFAAALAADDPVQLEQVGNDLEVTGSDLLAAEAATVAAAAYRRAGDPRRATAASRQARTRLDRCGPALTPLLLTAGLVNADLTPRERDVALAASHGESSKEIATSLGLSVRTVENHLHRAYTKLGVTSRRGLAEALGAG
jgi:DNA-binding CsgD family transcriptional regulator